MAKKSWNEMTIAEKLEAAICKDHRGKMKGLQSVSSSVLENSRCQERIQAALKAKEAAEKAGLPFKDIVCLHCFAAAQLSYQSTTHTKYARNLEFLTKDIYPVESFPILNLSIGRIESFGDVESVENGGVNQATNYINYCKRNPDTTFTAWTKNPDIWDKAFTKAGKPENLIMIYSDPHINGSIEDPETFLKALQRVFPWIDKIFIVYDKSYIQENSVNINCGAHSCNACRRCYRHNTESVIKEQLK